MSLNRRQVLTRGAATAGVVAATAGVVAATAGLDAVAGPAATATAASRGGPAADPARLFPPLKAAPGELLALPRGVDYEVVAVSGVTEIHDGTGRVIGTTPARPDGTGAVRTPTGFRLVQNHEIFPGGQQPVPLVEGTVYDRGVLGGGCTVIETTRNGRRRSE